MIFYLDTPVKPEYDKRRVRSMTEKKRLEDSKGESGLKKGKVDI